MIVAAASHNCVTLTYMSGLTDFGVCHCFKAYFLILMDTFETREFILGQISYTGFQVALKFLKNPNFFRPS